MLLIRFQLFFASTYCGRTARGRNKTTPGPTRFGFVAKSVLLGPEPE